ncbi:MAG: hypothetical protein IJR00_12625 [Lachnospiraceae bacterium]|nr:hypothetical protein [Lachnospiraceae bacterium]
MTPALILFAANAALVLPVDATLPPVTLISVALIPEYPLAVMLPPLTVSDPLTKRPAVSATSPPVAFTVPLEMVNPAETIPLCAPIAIILPPVTSIVPVKLIPLLTIRFPFETISLPDPSILKTAKSPFTVKTEPVLSAILSVALGDVISLLDAVSVIVHVALLLSYVAAALTVTGFTVTAKTDVKTIDANTMKAIFPLDFI